MPRRSTDPDDYMRVPRPIAAMAKDFPHGYHIPVARHARGQLVYAVSGVMTVTTPHGTWVVPPQRAVWVPPGTDHQSRMSGRRADAHALSARRRIAHAPAALLRDERAAAPARADPRGDRDADRLRRARARRPRDAPDPRRAARRERPAAASPAARGPSPGARSAMRSFARRRTPARSRHGPTPPARARARSRAASARRPA